MAGDSGALILDGGLAVAVALMLASAMSWQSARTARQRALQAGIAATRSHLDDLRRRHAAGEFDRDELEREERRVAAGLLDARPAAGGRSPKPWMLAVAAVAVAAAAGLIHAWVDRPGPSTPPSAAPAPAAPASGDAGHAVHALSDEQLQRMIDQTRLRLQKDPKDAASWAMLAHSYDMLGEFAESSKAYATLARLVPGNAQVLADYADALAVANGRTLAGEPAALVAKALALDPRNLKALTLAGTAAFERQDYGEAVARWQQARALSHDPAFLRQIDVSLANARASAQGLPASAPVVVAAAPATPASAVVAGRLTLAEDLVSKAPPDATVFIFAIPVGGSRMPVALTRRHVRDLPLEFALDDSMAMVRDLRLSGVATVVVGARISARGDIAPQPGDMQGLTAPLGVGTRGIRLEISEVLK